MIAPKSSEWRPPRWSFARLLYTWIDKWRMARALNRPRPRRVKAYSNAPFEAKVLTQFDIDS